MRVKGLEVGKGEVEGEDLEEEDLQENVGGQ